MKKTIERLRQAGIHPYGSRELSLFEDRLTRFFSREYKRILDVNLPLEACSINCAEGPMWEQTASLMRDHYDEHIQFFRSFLDEKYLAYTMAYYGDEPEQIKQRNLSLEQAQQAKFELVCERTGVRGDERIFNIGSGFAPLETYLLERYPGLEIVTLTPSQVQADFIRGRMSDSRHPLGGGNLSLLKADFGTVPLSVLGAESYDIVFAIGAFEHVRNWSAAFRRIAAILKPGGRHFQHLITSRMVIPKFMEPETTMIGSYYPGGRVWPFKLVQAQTDYLDLDQCWFLNGWNYLRTLNAWHERFWSNMDAVLDKVPTHERIRHWNNHFSMAKATLAPLNGRFYGNGQFLFRKPS